MASLTSKFINSIKPPEQGRKEYYDDSLTGFMLRVTKAGVMTWSVRYTVRGKGQQRHTIGTYPSLSLATARERARAIIEAAQSGVDLIVQEEEKQQAEEASRKIADTQTVARLSEIYMKEYREHNRPNSISACENELRHIVQHMGQTGLHAVQRRDVEQMCREISRTMPVISSRVWSRMRAFLAWAVANELIDVNVCASVTKRTLQRSLILKKAAPRERILSDEEIRRVLFACDTIGYPGGYFVRMLLLTGQRRDEVREMKWSEIPDLEAGYWIIPSDRYKTNVPHLVSLPSQAIDLLGKVKLIGACDTYVFAGKRKKGQAYNSRSELKQDIQSKSKTTEWTYHDLRRTVRSGMARIGVDRDTAERVIGHAVGTSLDRVYDLYNYQKEKAEALQRWADHLDTLVTAPVKMAS